MFVTPGSFCPLGRMMVQWSSKAKVAASQKVARTNSMIGEWAVATGDPPKDSAAKQLDTSSTMWNFVGGSKAPRARVMEDSEWHHHCGGECTGEGRDRLGENGSIFPRPNGRR